MIVSLTRKIKPSTLLFLALLGGVAKVHSQQFSSLVKQFISIKEDTFALIHVKVVDGTGATSKPNQALLIVKDQIVAVGDTKTTTIPPGVKTIDCTGKTLIPGMIMMHEHLFYGESQPPLYLGIEMPVSFPRLYLAGGATTIRTAGSTEPQTDLNIKKMIDNGSAPGPFIDATGPYIERELLPIPEIQFIKSSDDAANLVKFWTEKGSTSFKVYMDITRDDLKAVLAAAHENNLKVTGHICSVTYREAAELGIDNLEHGFLVSTDFVAGKKKDACPLGAGTLSLMKLDVGSMEMKDLMKFLIQKKVAITSTLPVFEPETGREVFPGGGDVAVVPEVKAAVEKNYNSAVNKDGSDSALFKKEMAWEKQFVDMGGHLMAGVDPTGSGRTIPGYADRHSLELFVEAGFTFAQAVKICTMNAAEYLGKDKEIGSIAVGKKADLVLIDGDPEKNINDVRKTEIVFKNGVGFDSKKLFESVNGKVGLY